MKKAFFPIEFLQMFAYFLKRCILILQNLCSNERKIALFSFPTGKRSIQKLAGIFLLFLLVPSFNLFAQTNSVSGTVKDANNLPLAGVSVLLKGTTTGTSTDAAGRFTISAPADGSLVFTNVGFDNQEIPIRGQKTLGVQLVPSTQSLDQVVVIGYGTVKKSDVTGSISTLGENDLNDMVIAPQQAMQGKVSGINITLNNGAPGANSSVRIRGGTSINASNAPLYVIDGVPVSFDESSMSTASLRQTRTANNPLNMISASDIKSIDVLKDASATAIYGARGANGVIIITTKQGKAGQSKINYDSYLEMSKMRKKYDLLSGSEFRSYINSHPEIKNWIDGGTETDWQDQIFRTAITHSHNLALSGGESKSNYRASVNYTNQEGIIIKSGLERITTRINLNHSALNDRLNIKFFLSGAMEKNHSAPTPESAGSDREGGIIRDALLYDPTYPVKDENGLYTFRGILNQNPVEEANTLIDITQAFRSLGNLRLDFKLTNSLSFNTNIGFTKEFVDRGFYAPRNSRIGSNPKGLASYSADNNSSKLLETNFLFKKIIKERHDINAIAGYSYQDFTYTGRFNQATNFISDVTTFNNLGAGLNQFPSASHKYGNTLISFYGRATYGFDNKYLVTVTVRRDGSSRFGANNKWGTFPSAAIAWKLTEENFLKNSNVVSNLKLRLGYGVTGNQEIGNYRSLPTLSAGGNLYIIGGSPYVAVGANQYYNPDLKWESSAQSNIGLDFGIFNNRITGSIDVYKKKTTDLLLVIQVPSPAEVNTTIANVGSLQNKGIEFEVDGLLISKEHLKWNFYGNMTHNSQKVISLSNETWRTDVIYTGSNPAPGFGATNPYIIKPGLPLNTFYGYKYLGVDKDGVQQFKDVNGDGQISPGGDRQVIGNSQPNLMYGFGSKISYKRFDFDIFFRGKQGAHVLNSTALDLQNITRLPAFNIPKETLSDGIAYGQVASYSSKWIQNASFLRLQSITVGYNFDLKSKRTFSKLNMFISGQNLFVLTPYTGFDPEVSNGIDYMNYPIPRSFIIGVGVEF